MNKRILLVGGVEITHWLFHEFLEMEGYIVCSLPSEFQLLQTIAQFKPELILLDVNFSEIGGYALLRQLQQLPSCYLTPIVVISTCEFEQQKALLLGVRSYLTKPVILEELVQLIENEICCFNGSATADCLGR